MTIWPVDSTERNRCHPAGWQWVPLVDVADLVTGHTPARDQPTYWNGEISWVNLNEIRELNGTVCERTTLQISAAGVANSSAVVHPAGTVCMSRTASVGFVTIMGKPMATSQDFVNWICGDRLHPSYLMRALMRSRPRVLALCSGSTHKTMYMRQAERLMVLLPPIEEQRRIGAVLDAADALRVKRNQALAKVELLVDAIFGEMFGVRTPSQWPLVAFGEIVRETKLGLVRGAEDLSSIYPWPYLRMNSIGRTGELELSDLKRTHANNDEVSEYKLAPGDLLFNTRNTRELVGKTAIYRGSDTVLFNNNLLRLRFRDDVDPEYVNAALRSTRVAQELETRKSGTTSVFAIYYKDLKTLPLPLPPAELQRRFGSRVAAVRERVRSARQALALCSALSVSLQQRAFRGEL